MSAVERSATAEAPPDAVWALLSDFGSISGWVPMIQHSCLLSEQTEGVGAVRRVQIARQTLVERVDTWEPPCELGYTIAGLPPMVGSVRNTWRITPTPAGCRIVLTTEIDTSRNPAKAVIAKKVLERMSMASVLMLAGLTAAVASTDEPDEHEEEQP